MVMKVVRPARSSRRTVVLFSSRRKQDHRPARAPRRVDDDYVGHGHESGQAGEELAPDGGLVFFEMKYAFEQEVFPSNKKVRHYRPDAARRQRRKCRNTDLLPSS